MRSLWVCLNKEEMPKIRGNSGNGRSTIDLDNLVYSDGKDCDKESLENGYLELIASLGRKADPVYWWASALSEKNSFSSRLFERLYKLEYLDRAIKAAGESDLVVICSDDALRSQIRTNYRRLFRVCSTFAGRIDGWSERYLSSAVGVMRQFARTIIEYRDLLATRRSLGFKRSKIGSGGAYVVLRTWADGRSYKSGSYEDPYFKVLIKHLRERRKNVLVFAGILQDRKALLKKFRDDADNLIVPTNYYLKASDIMRCLLISLFRRPKIKKAVCLNGRPVTSLIAKELRSDISSTRFFAAVLQYYSCMRLANAVRVDRFIYTFENYAWEKMSILGLRRSKKSFKTVGFQHAFIPKNNFVYFPGPAEREIMPLPDTIVTMGKRTNLIMQRLGNFPEGIFSIGCALRQEYLSRLAPLPRLASGDIFVPLTITVDDSVKVFRFLYESDLGSRKGKVYFRFHPATPLNKVMEKIGFSLPDNFIISDNPSIEHELARCSVVLYTWTTVCLEAIKMGRPVIYVDVNYPYDVDPLFECPHLKRVVDAPEKLLPVIDEICTMDDSAFEDESRKAQEYVGEYFYPVTKENLDQFLK